MKRASWIGILIGVCALSGQAQAQQRICDLPTLTVVLDGSGSMAVDGRWSEARNTLEEILPEFEGRLRVGLALFPGGSGCERGDLLVPPEVGNTAAFSGALRGHRPAGTSPIGTTVRTVSARLRSRERERIHYLLLVTDGADTCAGQEAATEMIASARDGGIPSFVIGFGGEVPVPELNDLALAGGFAEEPGHRFDPVFFQAGDGEELAAALEEVAGIALTELCDELDNDCDGETDEGCEELPWRQDPSATPNASDPVDPTPTANPTPTLSPTPLLPPTDAPVTATPLPTHDGEFPMFAPDGGPLPTDEAARTAVTCGCAAGESSGSFDALLAALLLVAFRPRPRAKMRA